MTKLCDEYILPLTVEDALQSLVGARGEARIIAGGSDLLLELQQGVHPPVQRLVDVTEIDEMRTLAVRPDSLFIGASVTLSRIAHSTLIAEHAQALADAAKQMANPQVCNVATIGGNVAHALPAADGSIALLALDAQAEVANALGRHRVSLRDLFKGPGDSTLDPNCDLLVGFYLPLRKEGQASAFTRRVNPQGIALAMLNMAIWLDRDGGEIKDIRIAVGPSGPVPMRLQAAELALRHMGPTPKTHVAALAEMLREAHFRTSPHRATAEYRRHLAGVLLEEALSIAWHRAGETLHE